MSQPSDRPGERLPIVDEVGAELRRLFYEAQEREAATGGRRFWRPRISPRRWRALALIGVLVLGGASGALAAAGVFQSGTPVGASVLAQRTAFAGVAIPRTVHILSLRVPDPAGGPPWALEELRTTRGLECVEPGRLVDGRLGVLGEDGAFGNDGRFHPLSDNAFQFIFNCATLDAHGHSFTVDTFYGLSASGLVAVDGDDAAANSLRDVYFGMLGPDATSLTYTGPGGRLLTSPTAGRDGAFLIVVGGDGREGESGGLTLTDTTDNPIRLVSYTGGRRCSLPAPAALARDTAARTARFYAEQAKRFPTYARFLSPGALHRPNARERVELRRIRLSAAYRRWLLAHRSLLGPPTCPTLGYTAPRLHLVTRAKIATTITASIERASSYCVSPTQVAQPCGASAPVGLQRVPASLAQSNVLLVVRWRTRVAITNQDSHYEVYNSNTGGAGCASAGTSFGPTESDYRAGQQVTYTSWMPIDCPGISHGSVAFVQDSSAAGSIPVPGQPGEAPDIPVGTFAVKVP